MINRVFEHSCFFLVMALLVCCLSTPVFAAKTVPTIRIEIPKKGGEDAVPSLDADIPKAAPSIPLEDEDLTPSIGDDPFIETPQEEAEPEAPFPDLPDDSEKADDTQDEPRKTVTILYGEDALPDAVKKTRKKLMEAALSGDIENLRPILESFEEKPILSFDEETDLITILKSSSGDGEGLEMLAILLEVLESGYVRRDEGEEGDIYIWPYFVEVPPENLTPKQIVELFQIITAGDFEDMQAYGTYIFYRVGITPNGELKFFVAGD